MLGVGRLLDLFRSVAQRPSARTTFEKFGVCKKTQPAHRDDASKNISDTEIKMKYNTTMKNEIAVKMSPEGLEVANTYLELGSVSEVCTRLKLDENTVSDYLNKREIKQYIDQVYLDTGYRNRFKLASTLDNIIEEKLAEAEESQMYTNKDVADLLQMAHKMRMDEIKAMAELEKAKTAPIKQQANIQINELPFGQGNYGKLMEKLIGQKD